jgi:hypothetical protein
MRSGLAQAMYTHPDSTPETPIAPEPVILAFARLDRIALGIALGSVLGGLIFVATIFLLAKGGPNPGRNLSLLSQYFFGYRVSLVGAVVGLAYGLVSGFVVGWLIASLRNLFLSVYLSFVRFDSDLATASEVFENPSEGIHKP